MLRTRVARGIANAKRTLRLRDIAPQSRLRFAPADAHPKISFQFFAAPPTPPAARRKEERKGNFWSAAALQKLRKEQLLKNKGCSFLRSSRRPRRVQFGLRHRAIKFVCACPTRPVRAQTSPPFLEKIVKRRSWLPKQTS